MKFAQVAIVTEESPILPLVASSFQRKGVFLPIFRPPRKFQLEADLLRLSNACSILGIRWIVFVGVSNEVVAHFGSKGVKAKVINSEADLPKLDSLPGFVRVGYRVSPPRLTGAKAHGRDVIAYEKGSSVVEALAASLALATNALVHELPPVSPVEEKRFDDSLHTWNNSEVDYERQDAKESAIGLLETRVGELRASEAKSITFFSSGIYYGLLPFAFPTSHIFSNPDVGLNVARSLAKTALDRIRVPVVVLWDLADSQEIVQSRNSFMNYGYLVRDGGKTAKSSEIALITENMPCDFIGFSSHHGRTRWLSSKRAVYRSQRRRAFR